MQVYGIKIKDLWLKQKPGFEDLDCVGPEEGKAAIHSFQNGLGIAGI